MYKVIKFLLFTIFICCLSGKANATNLIRDDNTQTINSLLISASFNLKRFHDVQQKSY